MEDIHSFQQRSSSDLTGDRESRHSRVIVVDGRNPSAWFTSANRPGDSIGFRWLMALSCRLGFFSRCCCCRCQSKSKPVGASSAGTRNGPGELKRRSASVSTIAHHNLTIDTGPFPANQWHTSKYTWFNFLPKNLFEQFRRLANFYFLITAILQMTTPLSPVGPVTSMLPLMFVVCTTSIKQAYEDHLRHKLDNEVNNRPCQVLREGRLENVFAKDIRVGDFVYVRNDHEIPCDMILLATTSVQSSDTCYITTANLDGETSLKTRTCFQIRNQLGSIESLARHLLVIECEQPNATLYEFNGTLRAPKSDLAKKKLISNLITGDIARSASNYDEAINQLWQRARARRSALGYDQSRKELSPKSNNKPNQNSKKQPVTTNAKSSIGPKIKPLSPKNNYNHHEEDAEEVYEISLDLSNLLLRASRLRNSSDVYGIAIYTGPDTKVARNSQVKPNKFSSTESRVNVYLTIAFLVLSVFTCVGALMYERPRSQLISSAGLRRDDSALEMIISHFLLYNYIVPISLYVTLEFIKFIGVNAVLNDARMHVSNTAIAAIGQSEKDKKQQEDDKLTGISQNPGSHLLEGPRCNSSDLNEELGQVEVLVTDKTGTLTENQMLFMAGSIGGGLYRCIGNQLYLQPEWMFGAPVPRVAARMANVKSNRHTHLGRQETDNTHDTHLSRPQYHHQKASKSTPGHHIQSAGSKQHQLAQDDKPFDHTRIPPIGALERVNPAQLDFHEQVAEFFMCLCLCSTITLNEDRPLKECLSSKNIKSEEYNFRSASADEDALITAAHQFGVSMCKSSARECFIVLRRPTQKVPQPVTGKFKAFVETKASNSDYIVRHFERLIVFEFNSVRKRMSVVYRDHDNQCIVMATKGSEELLDCVRFEPSAELQLDTTLAHFEAFAKSGLRTLLVAQRILQQTDLDRIEAEMRDARSSLHNREYLLDRLYRKAEHDLTLLGTTALEDTLQEGVPDTIANLKQAGIKIWLLTGDKVETAVSVAYLCKLLDLEMAALFQLVRQRDAQTCKAFIKACLVDVVRAHRKHRRAAIASASTEGSTKTSSASTSRGWSPSLSAKQTRARFALIADGRSLHYAMKHAKPELARLCHHCSVVLGCRLSPLQKAEIVAMIKASRGNPITAAIGDGANDVSMIQEAHVGIGISGKEGRQAVNSSDFAISRFRFLNRLLFVHGNQFYHRTANTILFFFYKNMLFILPQFLYNFFTLASAQSLYHPLSLISYNLFFTSLPILMYGLYERHLPEYLLESYPRLYQINRHNAQMALSRFIGWVGSAALQATSAFFVLYFIWASHTPFLESGKMADTHGFPTALFFAIALTATTRVYLLSRFHGFMLNLSICISLALMILVYLTYSFIDWGRFNMGGIILHGQITVLFCSPMFWLMVVVALLTTLIVDMLFYVPLRVAYFRSVGQLLEQKKQITLTPTGMNECNKQQRID